MTGTVRWFDPRKGYGYIEPDEGGADVFVHYGNVVRGDATLKPGERVRFEVAEAPYGPQATLVSRIEAQD